MRAALPPDGTEGCIEALKQTPEPLVYCTLVEELGTRRRSFAWLRLALSSWSWSVFFFFMLCFARLVYRNASRGGIQ